MLSIMQTFSRKGCLKNMVELYNFLFAWQLFPEMGTYVTTDRPKSGTYKINYQEANRTLSLELHWVNLNNQAFHTVYSFIPDGQRHEIADNQIFNEASFCFQDHKKFIIQLFSKGEPFINIEHEILHNGNLKLSEKKFEKDGSTTLDISIYHKQWSVLPYAASVGGAVIKPTETGMIRHKALSAMEEQTDLQLNQIRQQIELLAAQAQEINRRKELAMMIYSAPLGFHPVMGNIYHLYEKKDGTHFLSMIAPEEWTTPFVPIATVKMLADHTWIEVK